MKKLKIVAGIIFYEGKILCTQRGEGKYKYISFKYEFPGGKVEPGETDILALKREILEELSLEIDVKEKFLTVNHDYADFSIEMPSYYCIASSNNLILHEHINHKWLFQRDLKTLDWAEADVPIVKKLMENYNE